MSTAYINGKIYTIDKKESVAEAVLIEDGKFKLIGTNEEVLNADPNARVENLEGKCVLPAFFEAHAHISAAVSTMYDIPLNDLGSTGEYIKAVKDYYAENPDVTFIRGFGWKNTCINTEKNPRAMLDSVTTSIPIFLSSEDCHSTWVNSKAIELAGITSETSVENGIIEKTEDGKPNGIFRDTASALIESECPDYSVDEYKASFEQYFKDIYQYGFAGGLDALVEIDTNNYTAYRQLESEGKMPVYVCQAIHSGQQNTYEAASQTLKSMQKLPEYKKIRSKTLKIFLDGVVEGTTAALSEPYEKEAGMPEGYKCKPMWDQQELNKTVALADKMKIQVHIHAIGDMASKMAADAFEYAAKCNGSIKEQRHIITHLQLVLPETIEKMGRLGVIAVINPYWHFKDDYYYNIQVPFLGEERAEHEYPVRSFLESGVMIASASDFPVTCPVNPFEGMQIAITRRVPKTPDGNLAFGSTSDVGNPKYDIPIWPEEAPSLTDMIKSFTINAAYSCFLDDRIGSIEEGKEANFIIINNDIYQVPEEKLCEIRVLKTIVEGNEVYRL